MCDLDQPTQFLEGDGPAVVAPILLGVELLDSSEGIRPESMGVITPLREGADRRRVMVARRQRSAFLPESTQGLLDALGGEMRQPGWGDSCRQRLARSGQFRGGRIRWLDLRQGGSAEQRDDPTRSTEG